MAGREKVSSIYVTSRETAVAQAYEDFKGTKDKLDISHSDLYKSGLALFKANPSIISTCVMLLTHNKLTPENLAHYLSFELGSAIKLDTADGNGAPEKNTNHINTEDNSNQLLLEMLREQAKKIDALTKLIAEQNSIIKKFESNQLNESIVDRQSADEEKPLPNNYKDEVNKQNNSIDTDESELNSLEAFDQHGNAKMEGIIKEKITANSGETKDKIRKARRSRLF